MLAAAIMIITVPGLGSGAGSGTAKVPSSLSGGLGEKEGALVICTHLLLGFWSRLKPQARGGLLQDTECLLLDNL